MPFPVKSVLVRQDKNTTDPFEISQEVSSDGKIPLEVCRQSLKVLSPFHVVFSVTDSRSCALVILLFKETPMH